MVITVFSLIIGSGIGFILALLRDITYNPTSSVSRILVPISKIGSSLFVEIFRGLPIMIIVLLICYLPFVLFKIRLPGAILAIFAFSLYAGVYMCEIFRSGFRAVDSNLINTGKILGLSSIHIMLHITFPIAFRTMTPAMLGLAITIFKDSAVLVVVAIPDLTYTARQMQLADPKNYALILSLVIFLYWGIATVGSVIAHRLESKWDRIVSV